MLGVSKNMEQYYSKNRITHKKVFKHFYTIGVLKIALAWICIKRINAMAKVWHLKKVSLAFAFHNTKFYLGFVSSVLCLFWFYLTINIIRRYTTWSYLILSSMIHHLMRSSKYNYSVISYKILRKLFSNKLMLARNIQSSKE